MTDYPDTTAGLEPRRTWRAVAALLLAIAPLSLGGQTLGTQPPPSVPLADDATFTVAMNTATIEGSPVYVAADRLGGANIRLISGGVRNLANGTAHAATNAETQLLIYGTPNVRLLFTVAEGLYRVVASRSAGIRTPSDLRGKRVTTPRDTSAHYYLVRTLQRAGLRETDVTLVDLPRDQMAAGVADGRTDAVVMWEPEAEKAVVALGANAVVFQDNAMYRELFSLYSTSEVLRNPRRRAELVRFARAVLSATADLKRTVMPHLPLIAKTVQQSEAWVSRSWMHHAFPAAVPTDLLDVMVQEDVWIAGRQGRTARSRASLDSFIDRSILTEARTPASTR
jgi:sulfonate transport system substrate-binding protein